MDDFFLKIKPHCLDCVLLRDYLDHLPKYLVSKETENIALPDLVTLIFSQCLCLISINSKSNTSLDCETKIDQVQLP